MRIYNVPTNDLLKATKHGDFYMDSKHIEINKDNYKLYVRYYLETFVGKFDFVNIRFKNGCYTDIDTRNIMYDLITEYLDDSHLSINNIVFKRIENFKDYYISSDGTVYSKIYNKLLFPKINKDNYYSIGLFSNGKRKYCQIHRLVYETWNDTTIDEGYQINHINSKPWINSLWNLELSSPLENIRHSIHYNNRYSKWKKSDVEQICYYLQYGLSPDEIYQKMNLCDVLPLKQFRSFTRYLVLKKKFWKDVSSKYDFTNAYTKPRKYDDEFIEYVLEQIALGRKQKDIAEELSVDFRVISEIKNGIKKLRKIRCIDRRSTTIES